MSEVARSDARRQLGLDSEALVLGTVARLDPVKELLNLISAFREISAATPNSCLVVIGDAPERQNLEAEARLAGLEFRAIFTGSQGDARSLMRAFDIYVKTSVTDGISVTILEGMAGGLPVVATGGSGRRRVEQKISMEQVTEAYVKVYREESSSRKTR